MNWSASVLSTVSSDTEPTIILTFDSAKYIFNAGENANRSFLQSRWNWKRTRGIFLTQVGTTRASGLPGLLMSFADATIPRLDIVGPPGLTHFMAAMRSYMFRDSMPVYPTEASWIPTTSPSPDALYKDDNITVYGIPILPDPESVQDTFSSTPGVASDSRLSSPQLKRKRDISPDLPAKRPSLVSDDSAETVPSHIIVQDADAVPATLTGDAAHDWRKLMVKTMFPGLREKSEKVDAQKRKEKERKGDAARSKTSGRDPPQKRREHKQNKADDGVRPDESTHEQTSPAKLALEPTPNDAPQQSQSLNIDIYRRPRLPSGFHNQLPKFISFPSSSSTEPDATPTLAYIVVGPRVRGKFDVKKAEALGVPFGPKRGHLTKGQTITFSVRIGDEMVERVVRPEECVGESEAPGVTLILDVPTPSHIPSLISSFENSSFYSKFRSDRPEDLKDYSVRSVFHLCGNDVLEDRRYISFMNGFGVGVHHLISSREQTPDPVTFTSAAYNQLRLNQLDPEIFPIPKFSLSVKKDLGTIPNLPTTARLMSSNLLINMRPPAPPNTETSADRRDLFHPAVSLAGDAVPLPALTLERFSDAKAYIEEHIKSGKVHVPNGADVKVIPLGTGSAVPTKYRNVSSTLIQIPRWGNILLDTGEGTWGQLVRQFGLGEMSSPHGVWQMLRDLKCIFISHIHGDHHMGLAKILAQRRLLDPPPSEPLYLVTIRAAHLYLRELSDIQNLGLDDPSGNGVVTIMAESLHWKSTGAYQTSGMWQVGGHEPWTDFQQSQINAQNMCRALGLESFQTVDVYHRTRCYGTVIKHTDNWSIVFSGDTQPTNTLVWAGKNATLLIHEATMADDQEEMAQRKAHSTFGQAVDIGKRMNAENILLTHFSARYPKMPPSGVVKPNQIEETPQKRLKEPIVALAFDHANLTIGNMWKLNYYLPAVEQSFKDTVEEGDNEDVDLEISMDVGIS